MVKQLYRVEGMHCKSCEILIEDSLENVEGIKKAEVDLVENRLEIDSKEKIKVQDLNKMFKKNGYSFKPLVPTSRDISLDRANSKVWWVPAIGVIIVFLLLNKFGLASFLNINNQSSLLTFFIFGIIAGFSSCGALLSGIIISYPGRTLEIIIGRIISYTTLGIVLGMLGQTIALTGFSNVLIIIVSLVMVIVALQMLQVKWAQKVKINLPKSISKKVVGEKMPVIIGFLTVLLPCGFTLLTESVAMLSGNWFSGMLIMLVFVLGTSIPLFLIGLSSKKLLKSQKTMGLLVLFFVLYTLNLQFRILNPSKSPFDKREILEEIKQEPDQIVKTTYTRFLGLSPYTLTVKKGERVRIEIEVKDNEYGCMSTIMLPGLFSQAQTLVAGQTIVMEFTPQKAGNYQFTCAMGVPHRGEVNVVE